MQKLETGTKLNYLAKNPDLLIPQHLLDISPNPNAIQAANFNVWIGRMDNEYQPSLSAIIYLKEAFSDCPKDLQEDTNDNWSRALNGNRLRAVRQGLMTNRDEALITLIAQDRPEQGVYIETYLDTARLRHQGVGKAFLTNFKDMLSQMGYRYMWGINNEKNLTFFLQFGNYTLDQIKDELLRSNPVIFSNISNRRITTIHFFDKQMEEYFVKPKDFHSQNPDFSKILIPSIAQGE